MTAITQALTSALIHFVWQGAVVAPLLWITLFALRNRSAEVRYSVSCAALAVLALLPLATMTFVYQASPGPDSGMYSSPGSSQTQATTSPGVPSSQGSYFRQLQRWMLPAWSMGVLLFSMRLLWACSHVIKLRRHGSPADESVVAVIRRLSDRMGINRTVRVLISTIAEVPSVIGCLRPVILLPAASLMGLTPVQLEAVLAHELAHIRRLDYFMNILQMVTETLLFYHPAVWWTSRRIRLERELCCDDLAVRSCGDALTYARALTALEKLRVETPGLAMASTNGPLLYRIQRILGTSSLERQRSWRLSAVIAIVLGIACLGLNAHWLRGQPQTAATHLEPPAFVAVGPDFPGVHVDLGSSSVIHRSAVRYPLGLAKKGVKGTVQVEVTLDASGLVSDARVLSGPQELRKAALQSVLDWHFTRDAANTNRQINITFDPTDRANESTDDVFLENAAVNFEEPVGAGIHVTAPSMRWFTIERTKQAAVETEPAPPVADAKEAVATAELKKHLESVKIAQLKQGGFNTFLFEQGHSVPSIQGRTVNTITAASLSDPVRNEVIARLPVREGDTLTPESIQATIKAVRDFDEHLGASFRLTDETHVNIEIVVGGMETRDFIAVRRER